MINNKYKGLIAFVIAISLVFGFLPTVQKTSADSTVPSVGVHSICRIKQVISTSYGFFVLMNDGSLYSWGKNTDGKLGIGDLKDTKVLRKILSNVKKINDNTEGDFPGCYIIAIKKDGTLWTWGHPDGYILRNISVDDYTIPFCIVSSFIMFLPLHYPFLVYFDEEIYY